jgi:transposase-like protein
MLAKIRRLHLRDGMSIREVCRRTGLSRNTVRAWLRQEGVTEPKYPKRVVGSAVDVFAEHLEAALRADGCGSGGSGRRRRRAGRRSCR